MIRAGVFIGIDKTGNLQKLNDAAASAERMRSWALSQGLTQAKLITDAGGQRVKPDMIYESIKEIVDGPGVDQLIVYFAGHGVNINRGELWLLTDAPRDSSAAVNVAGSVELARYCGIQHVVIISDACRVAPEGIQAQSVRGVDVFPNDGSSDRAKPVDQFFACLLGKTAAELRDPTLVANNYTALYTSALLDALKGGRQDVLEPSSVPGDLALYVIPRTLERYLESEVPRRVTNMGLAGIVNQSPDAIITSDKSWLSRIDRAIDPTATVTRGVAQRLAPRPPSLRSVSQGLLRSVASVPRTGIDVHAYPPGFVPVEGAAEFEKAVWNVAAPFGPDHFETECGIKVRGTRIVDFVIPRANGEPLGNDGDLLRVSGLNDPAASILLRFEGGIGTVIPVVKGFLAALTFDEGELVDVAYEPSRNSWLWNLYEDRAQEVRTLRAVAASSSRHGRFRLEGTDAIVVAKKMQYAKGIDPTLAVYAAYAYHDLQATDRIRAMSGFLRDSLQFTFFDLELLSRALVDKSIVPNDVVPFAPLLSQGWALLRANRVELHPALSGVERTLRDSLWSLFDTNGLEKIGRAMRSGDVR